MINNLRESSFLQIFYQNVLEGCFPPRNYGNFSIAHFSSKNAF